MCKSNTSVRKCNFLVYQRQDMKVKSQDGIFKYSNFFFLKGLNIQIIALDAS